jgi:hypothetical protein
VFTGLTGRRVGKQLGTLDFYGYIFISVLGRRQLAHRLAWLYVHGELPKEDMDHINGVRNDNRLANLRVCSRAENMQNSVRDPGRNSRLVGVTFDRNRGKWFAQIRRDRKQFNIGRFNAGIHRAAEGRPVE